MITREEILAMQPGREMDALVAQHVFPDSKDYFIPTWSDKNYPYQWDEDGNEITWKPSTDISAAWEVAEKMKEQNWWIVLNSEGETWNAMFYWDPHQQACEAESNAAPEAICKAALLAITEA